MKIGFIGCGNMAGAIIRGILAAGAADPQEIIGADLSDFKAVQGFLPESDATFIVALLLVGDVGGFL